MTIKIKNGNEIKELPLPLECDYGAIVENDIITGVCLPVNEKVIPKEYVHRIILNQSKYSNLLATIEREMKVSDDI